MSSPAGRLYRCAAAGGIAIYVLSSLGYPGHSYVLERDGRTYHHTMLIEGRFMRNLRTLLLLVVCLGTVQYLIGSYILNQTAREPARATAKVDVAINKQDELISEDDIPAARVLSSQAEMEVTSKHVDNRTATTSLNAKMDANVTQVNQDVQIVKVADSAKKTNMNVTVKANITNFCDGHGVPLGERSFKVNIDAITLRDVEEKYPEVSQGGYYKPLNCTARIKVAIIVPYRDRQYHLSVFLNNIHPFLMKQQIEYRVFVVEQKGTGPFNRGKLFNVGFMEGRKLGYHCFIFHDVDVLPLDTRNFYNCPTYPQHMTPPDDDSNTTEYFGSVNALKEDQFIKVNGFSNRYWNLGGENEDMTIRLKANKLRMLRYLPSIHRYLKLNHTRSIPSPKRLEILKNTHKHYGSDGLSSLEYEVCSTNANHLYTHWMVDLTESKAAGNRTPPQIRTTPFVDELMDIKVSLS